MEEREAAKAETHLAHPSVPVRSATSGRKLDPVGMHVLPPNALPVTTKPSQLQPWTKQVAQGQRQGQKQVQVTWQGSIAFRDPLQILCQRQLHAWQ